MRTAAVRLLPSFPLIAALIAYSVVLFVPAVLNDADTYWHLATGDWILDHHAVPHTDPFSFTMAGQPWVAHEWLSEVLMALAYRAGGWSTVALLFACAAAVTAGALARYLSRWLSLPAAALVALLGTACVSPSLLARPHLLALPMLTLWTIGLLSAEAHASAPRPRLLVLMLIWANLHGSFVLGLAMIPALAADAMLDARGQDVRRCLRNWSLFFIAAVTTSLLTPHGANGLLFPFRLLAMHHVAQIGEWRPLDLTTLQPLEPALAVLGYVMAFRRVRVPLVRLLIVLGLACLAYRHARHEMLAGIVGAAMLAEPLGRSFGPPPAAAKSRAPLPGAAVALACAIALAALRFAHPIVRGDDPVSPVAAVAAVPADRLDAPVLNSYEFGGYLVFRHVKPFVDGRADMYGDAFMSAYFDALKPDRAAIERLVERYRIRWALLAAHGTLAEAMATLPGWRRIHADNVAVAFVRDGP
ncbi:hypothetical protein BZL54_12835 [Burkholderia ubonensis subsp. mesacidophila]|uniref:Glycosyltransferase RgtA/B/C/D-like domain-containing protein n=1 Tax=Burkholderia ubonensis subsp. mesacidophila TaxID=265293 RepID=A0A2A4FF05_9BURK|nr:hypothetical protein BZL54_12835 [Burkholderia ubonensis subsp. mesacidophila]